MSSSRPCLVALLACASVGGLIAADFGDIGSFAKWQKIEIVVEGPTSSATATPNPFNMHMDVTFNAPDGDNFVVPGFYNGDNAGGESGNKWLVRFAADETGDWTFTTASAVAQLDGHSGSFSVTAIPGDAQGFYRWGRLHHPGTAANQLRYLKFQDGPYWIKGGADSPESFLSLSDGWRWDTNAKRRQAIDYLASVQINSMYIMTCNITGDNPKGVWPLYGDDATEVQANQGSTGSLDDPGMRFSIPRLEEWLPVFEYMQTKSLVVYIIGEDDDTTGTGNRLRYYRELIARYGWLPGVMFNTREEGGGSWEDLEHWTTVDPYGIPGAGHNVNSASNSYVDSPHTDMTSIQTNNDRGGLGHNQSTIDWINLCKSRGQRVLMVSYDEPRGGAIPRQKWWAAYLGGAGGYEEIFVPIDKGDRDFSYYDSDWREIAGARRFMEGIQFWKTDPRNDLITAGNAFCLAEPGEQYAVYMIDGSSFDIELVSGRNYRVDWWNPENDYAGDFEGETLVAGGTVTLTPPAGGSAFGDWACRIRRDTGGGNVPPSASDGSATLFPGESVAITLSYSDADGPGPYTFTIVDQPVQGTLSGTGASRTYTADSDATPGTDDVFTWRVDDGVDDSNLATVTITIDDPANNVPVAADASATTSTDTPVEVALLWDDPDGPGPYTITIVTPPAHGSVAATTVGGNEYRYTPAAGYTGPDSFQWSVNDGELDSNVATVSLLVSDVQSGLLAWWPLDDGAGSSTAEDASGNGRDGTLLDLDLATAWVDGQIGGALSFAGNGDRFEVVGSFDPTDAGSIAFWIRPGSGSGERLMGGSDSFEITYGGTISNQLFAGGGDVLGGSTSVDDGQWHHVVCTWDLASNAASIWVDGTLDASGNTANDDPGAVTLSVGTRTGQSSSFVGALDDLRIYDRVLDSTEIATLAGQTVSGQPPVIETPAAVAADPVTSTGTTASVTASDPDGDDAALSYQWTVVSGPGGAAAPQFVPNDSPSAAATAITFHEAGSYGLRVTVTDTDGLTAVSDVTVGVEQTASDLQISP